MDEIEGDFEMENVELKISDIRIRFLNEDGEPAKPGEIVRLYNFEVTGPGIDPNRVKSVTIPKLDYGSSDVLTVVVEMYPFDPGNIPERGFAAMTNEPTGREGSGHFEQGEGTVARLRNQVRERDAEIEILKARVTELEDELGRRNRLMVSVHPKSPRSKVVQPGKWRTRAEKAEEELAHVRRELAEMQGQDAAEETSGTLVIYESLKAALEPFGHENVNVRARIECLVEEWQKVRGDCDDALMLLADALIQLQNAGVSTFLLKPAVSDGAKRDLIRVLQLSMGAEVTPTPSADLIAEVKLALGIGLDAPDVTILGDLNLIVEARKRLREFLIECTDEYGEDEERDVQDAAIAVIRKLAEAYPEQKIVELAGKGDTFMPRAIVERAKELLRESTDAAVVRGLTAFSGEAEMAVDNERDTAREKWIVAHVSKSSIYVEDDLRHAYDGGFHQALVSKGRKPNVGIGVVCFQEGRILLGKRHPDLDGGGQWELPGGSLEWGESWEEAAIREVAEETGIVQLTNYRFLTAKEDHRPEDAKHNAVIFVRFDVKGKAVRKEPDKSTEWGWYSLDKLPEGPMFPALRELLTTDRGLLA